MNEETRKEIISKLAFLKWKQEPPRIRTIMHDGKTIQLAFPWVSTTAIALDGTIGMLYAFFHSKKWDTVEEAYELFRTPPHFFHAQDRDGNVCVSSDVEDGLIHQEISPSEAFWMTENLTEEGARLTSLPAAMWTRDPEAVCRSIEAETSGKNPNGSHKPGLWHKPDFSWLLAHCGRNFAVALEPDIPKEADS